MNTLNQKSAVKINTGAHLINPKDHCIFQVKGQLLGSTEVGEALDTGHHPLYAHHLCCERHHQSIDQGDVGTLENEQRILY